MILGVKSKCCTAHTESLELPSMHVILVHVSVAQQTHADDNGTDPSSFSPFPQEVNLT